MNKYIEICAKTEEDAIKQGLEQIGKNRDDVSIEIIERSKSGFLGIGACDAKVKISYEYEETKSEKVEKFLKGLFDRMDVKADLDITEEDGVVNVIVSGDTPGALIGRRGETLDAIQHLTNYAVNRTGSRVRVNIDAENYRERRNDALVKLAEKMAAKVIKYHRNMTLEPMNSYERHVIHTALQEYEGVSTFSTGNEPNRRVVIAYERKAPEYREWK